MEGGRGGGVGQIWCRCDTYREVGVDETRTRVRQRRRTLWEESGRDPDPFSMRREVLVTSLTENVQRKDLVESWEAVGFVVT